MDHRMTIKLNGKYVQTLSDILPDTPGLRVLFVAKTPAPVSVKAGHYFQGKQGRMFWNRLRDYKVFEPPLGKFEDNYLLKNGFGITDIVKVPRHYGDEPSNDEYRDGLARILSLIRTHKPLVVVFVYKKVLDQILKFGFGWHKKSQYGFNHDLKGLFNSEVFVFPMPGTPCSSDMATQVMNELRALLQSCDQTTEV